jgi:lysylphosphatidylglycerol synthetase-like protein (DUF2156 family)
VTLIGRASRRLDPVTESASRIVRGSIGWSLFALFWLGIAAIVRAFA